jgi:hypothetical protein
MMTAGDDGDSEQPVVPPMMAGLPCGSASTLFDRVA